jgi:hypothetical protein
LFSTLHYGNTRIPDSAAYEHMPVLPYCNTRPENVPHPSSDHASIVGYASAAGRPLVVGNALAVGHVLAVGYA